MKKILKNKIIALVVLPALFFCASYGMQVAIEIAYELYQIFSVAQAAGLAGSLVKKISDYKREEQIYAWLDATAANNQSPAVEVEKKDFTPHDAIIKELCEQGARFYAASQKSFRETSIPMPRIVLPAEQLTHDLAERERASVHETERHAQVFVQPHVTHASVPVREHVSHSSRVEAPALDVESMVKVQEAFKNMPRSSQEVQPKMPRALLEKDSTIECRVEALPHNTFVNEVLREHEKACIDREMGLHLFVMCTEQSEKHFQQYMQQLNGIMLNIEECFSPFESVRINGRVKLVDFIKQYYADRGTGVAKLLEQREYARAELVLKPELVAPFERLLALLFKKNGDDTGLSALNRNHCREIARTYADFLRKRCRGEEAYRQQILRCKKLQYVGFDLLKEYEDASWWARPWVSNIKVSKVINNSFYQELKASLNSSDYKAIAARAEWYKERAQLAGNRKEQSQLMHNHDQLRILEAKAYQKWLQETYNAYGMERRYSQDPLWKKLECAFDSGKPYPAELIISINKTLERRERAYKGIVQKLKIIQVSPPLKEFIYGLTDILHDPGAVLEYLSVLSKDSSNALCKEAYPYFFDHRGIIRLYEPHYELLEQIIIPKEIHTEAYREQRILLSKFLLTHISGEATESAVLQGIYYAIESIKNNKYLGLARAVHDALYVARADKAILSCGNFACVNDSEKQIKIQRIALDAAQHIISELSDNVYFDDLPHKEMLLHCLDAVNRASYLAQGEKYTEAENILVGSVAPYIAQSAEMRELMAQYHYIDTYATIARKLRFSHTHPKVKAILDDIVAVIDDPLAVIDLLSCLSKDHADPILRDIYAHFFDENGVIRLYAYDKTLLPIYIPEEIHTQAYAEQRTLLSKLLLYDTSYKGSQNIVRQGAFYIIASIKDKRYLPLAYAVYDAFEKGGDATILACGDFCYTNDYSPSQIRRHNLILDLASQTVEELREACKNKDVEQRRILSQRLLNIEAASACAQQGNHTRAERILIEQVAPHVKHPVLDVLIKERQRAEDDLFINMGYLFAPYGSTLAIRDRIHGLDNQIPESMPDRRGIGRTHSENNHAVPIPLSAPIVSAPSGSVLNSGDDFTPDAIISATDTPAVLMPMVPDPQNNNDSDSDEEGEGEPASPQSVFDICHITSQARELCRILGIEEGTFDRQFNDSRQMRYQNRIVALINEASQFYFAHPHNQQICIATSAITNMGAIAQYFNENHNFDHYKQMLEAVDLILDYVRNIAQGVVEGVQNTASTIGAIGSAVRATVQNPADTAYKLGKAFYLMTNSIIDLSRRYGPPGEEELIAMLTIPGRWEEWHAERDVAWQRAYRMWRQGAREVGEYARNVTGPDVARGVARFATETMAFNRALRAGGQLLEVGRAALNTPQARGLLTGFRRAHQTLVNCVPQRVQDVRAYLAQPQPGFISLGNSPIHHRIITTGKNLGLEETKIINSLSNLESVNVGGNLQDLNQAIEMFEYTPGFNDPFKKVLEYAGDQKRLSTAKGAFYEIQKGLDLKKHGEEILEFGKKFIDNSKSFKVDIDILTTTKVIECKNIQWLDIRDISKFSREQLDYIQKLKGSFIELKKAAADLERSFELHSRNKIPESWREWLNKKSIKFVEDL